MALNAYLELEGGSQGQIKGSSRVSGQEDKIIVHAADHRVYSKIRSGSGLATGKRRHTPFTITKEVDQSSPLLYLVLTTNERITKFKLQFYTSDPSGMEVNHYSVELENAAIVDIQFSMLHNKFPENMPHKEYEEISFSYEKITWTWEDGGIQSEDDWGSKSRK